MHTGLAFRSTPTPVIGGAIDPKVLRRIEPRRGETPVYVAQQAARAELMLLHDVRDSAEYMRHLSLDTSEACAEVIASVQSRWKAADFGVVGRGRKLAALDLAANTLMLGLVFTGPRSAAKREGMMRQFRANRRERDGLLDQLPRLRAMEIQTPANVTLAPRKFWAKTRKLDANTIALELMIERRELIQPGSDGNLDIIRVTYIEA